MSFRRARYMMSTTLRRWAHDEFISLVAQGRVYVDLHDVCSDMGAVLLVSYPSLPACNREPAFQEDFSRKLLISLSIPAASTSEFPSARGDRCGSEPVSASSEPC